MLRTKCKENIIYQNIAVSKYKYSIHVYSHIRNGENSYLKLMEVETSNQEVCI